MGEAEAIENPEAATRARRRLWWRRGLRLRTLLLAVLIIGAGLGLLTNRVATRQRAITTIREAGGKISFRDQDADESGPWIQLYHWTGSEFCREVVAVNYAAPRADVAGRASPAPLNPITTAIGQLAETKRIALSQCSVRTSDLAALANLAIDELLLGQMVELVDDLPQESSPLPRLKGLQLEMGPGRNLPRAALSIAVRFPTLERLYCISPLDPVRADDLAPLAHLQSLTLLDLGRTAIDESGLGFLSEMPRLEAIWVRRAKVSDRTFKRIVATHPDLVSIEVDGSALSDEGVASLLRASNLVMVILRGTPSHPGSLTDASLITLGRIRSLRRLVVTCGRFGAAGIDALRDLKLVRLALRSVEAGATDSLILLTRQQIFEWLRLGGPGVTDALLPHLTSRLIPRRAILDLSDSAITDAGLVDLASLPVAELLIHRTAITDAGLAGLPRSFGPSTLDEPQGSPVTPAGLAAFSATHPGVLQPSGLDDDD